MMMIMNKMGKGKQLKTKSALMNTTFVNKTKA